MDQFSALLRLVRKLPTIKNSNCTTRRAFEGSLGHSPPRSSSREIRDVNGQLDTLDLTMRIEQPPVDFPDITQAVPVEILAWRPFIKRDLVGFVGLVYGPLRIFDVAVHVRGMRRWCSLPDRPVVGPDGRVIRDDQGRLRYVQMIAWGSQEAATVFSRAVIAELERAYPDALQSR